MSLINALASLSDNDFWRIVGTNVNFYAWANHAIHRFKHVTGEYDSLEH